MPFTIRRLTPADAAAHRALMLEAYAAHPDAFTSSTEERTALPLAWWAERLPEGAQVSSLVIGGFDAGGQLLGAAGLSVEPRTKARHKGLLFGMYVAPAARRDGLGLQLVDAVLAAARARGGLRLVQLTVTQGNDGAQALYARCGFQVFGVEPMAVRIGERDFAKVHMWRELE